MSYESIDAVIHGWARDHKLSVFTECKDYEVRSVDLVASDGTTYELWIDPPTKKGVVAVHAWDHEQTRLDYAVPVAELAIALDAVYSAVLDWISRREKEEGR